jgi:GNAT superfamily N-acetyltransferase
MVYSYQPLPDKVTTRVATPDDAYELVRLNRAFNGVDEPPERLALRLCDLQRVEIPILAEVDGRVVGFASLRVVLCVFYATPHAELTELFVEPGYRRRGVGRALVAHAERLAREREAEKLVVLTGFTNLEGQAFYRAVGYTDRELAMGKTLRLDRAANPIVFHPPE